MRLLDKMKHKIRSFLEIHEDVSGTITLINLNDFETEANIARVWSWGDRKALEQLYKNLDNGSGLNFWKAVPSQGLVKRHTGIPKTILKTLTDIIIADMNDIKVADERKAEWDDMVKKLNIKKIIKRAVSETFIVGDGVFTVSVNTGGNEYPVIDFVSGDKAEYVRVHGEIKEIRIKLLISHNSMTYVHEEIYGYGYIKNELYFEGKQVKWGTIDIPLLNGIEEIITFNKSFIMAVPLMFEESVRYEGRGQSLFSGKFDSFDSLDETWSQWMDALRKGRSKEYIPKAFIPVDENTGELLAPNDFDNTFIAIEDNVGENAKNEILVKQPVIPHESYTATYITALDLCLQGIISPSTLGIDVKKLDNADAQREKEKATLYTRNGAVAALQETVPKLIDIYFKAWDTAKKSTLKDTKAELPFGEYANPSFESQVETVSKAKTGGIMSVEASVEELYGDSKDDEWKKKEVSRIKAEQGITEAEEPSINTETDGFQIGFR